MIRRMLIHSLLAALLVTTVAGAVQAFSAGPGHTGQAPFAGSEGGRDGDD